MTRPDPVDRAFMFFLYSIGVTLVCLSFLIMAVILGVVK